MKLITEATEVPRNFTGIAEWLNGVKEYYVDGKRHRTDGPACEYPSGAKSYYVNGKRHRLDGPAVEYADGSKEYYINNVIFFKEDWKKQVELLKNPSQVMKCFSINNKVVEIDGKKYKLTEI